MKLRSIGLVVATLCACNNLEAAPAAKVEFAVAADIREFSGVGRGSSDYFGDVCKALVDVGPGDFMVGPGDIDPPAAIQGVLNAQIGSNYIWYPVVGNHEAETPADMEWLRSWGSNDIPGLVRRGPQGTETTTFSFNRGPVHFVVLNQYYNGTSDFRGKGDVVPRLYKWLKADLAANKLPQTIVVGHEPILPTPDMDNGRLRHEKDSLNQFPENCEKFRQLLVEHKVTAYICAHTHNASITNLGGVWQIDAGHARGKGDPGAPSTFLKFRADGQSCTVEFHRQRQPGGAYTLTHSQILAPGTK